MAVRNSGRTRYQKLALRVVAVSASLITAAATLAASAQADPIDDPLLGALDNPGFNVGDSGSAAGLGQSVCPMLEKPGTTVAETYSRITGKMSPEMAGFFTRIAISMYCPSMMQSVAEGHMPSLPQVPGMPGMPGTPGLPGL